MITNIYSFKKSILVLISIFLISQSGIAQCPIINQTPVASNSSFCVTGSATITIPSSQIGVTYALLTGTTIVSGPSPGTGSAIGFPTGTFTTTTTFSVGATNGTCTVTMVPPLTLTVNPLPTVVLNGNNTTCSGQPDQLFGSGASTYTWSTGATTDTITPSPTVNTTFTVTGTDSNACVNFDTMTVMVNPNPTVTIAGTNTMCVGDSVMLMAQGALTYTWSTTDTGSVITVKPGTTSTYSVVGTDINGCTNTASFTVTVNNCTTGMNIVSTDRFNIYPNPNSGNFIIQVEKPVTITISNILGRIIMSRKLDAGLNVLSIENQPKGLYYIRSLENSRIGVIKIVVQ